MHILYIRIYIYMFNSRLPEVEPGCLVEGLPKIDDHHDAWFFGHSATIIIAAQKAAGICSGLVEQVFSVYTSIYII